MFKAKENPHAAGSVMQLVAMAWPHPPDNPVLRGILFILFLPALWPAVAVDILCKVPYFDRLETKYPHHFKLVTGLSTFAWLIFLFSGGLG